MKSALRTAHSDRELALVAKKYIKDHDPDRANQIIALIKDPAIKADAQVSCIEGKYQYDGAEYICFGDEDDLSKTVAIWQNPFKGWFYSMHFQNYFENLY